MFPPSHGFALDIEAISGICGCISIACWVVVFSPQIVENYQRSSADSLSIVFVVVWLLGDVFNILGAVLQGVLPTMIVLAIYYTLADAVLLGQCFYYRGFTLRDHIPDKSADIEVNGNGATERTALLSEPTTDHRNKPLGAADADPNRTRSVSTFHEHFATLDGTYLSPANPMHPQSTATTPPKATTPRSFLQQSLFNLTAILLVVLSGIAGYFISLSSSSTQSGDSDGPTPAEQANALRFNLLGQVFGYVCAALYLYSRVPQILLNYRKKSTEGLNALFFLFACIGNLTYVMSICFFEPVCADDDGGAGCAPPQARAIYARYLLVNLSWLLGSLGTLFLDAMVFAQFWMYRKRDGEDVVGGEGAGGRAGVPDDVPRIETGEGRGRAPNER
ncbi:hypothetical protein LTR50_001322 [Elasticomyces elasticus]|nr:hypothetical protein LTR50_001322 [Elasticomyces elasticus]